MKCQSIFCGKNKKNISECHLPEILPSMLSVKQIAKDLISMCRCTSDLTFHNSHKPQKHLFAQLGLNDKYTEYMICYKILINEYIHTLFTIYIQSILNARVGPTMLQYIHIWHKTSIRKIVYCINKADELNMLQFAFEHTHFVINP